MDFAGDFVKTLHTGKHLCATRLHRRLVLGRERGDFFGSDFLFEHSVNRQRIFDIRAADFVVNLADNKVGMTCEKLVNGINAHFGSDESASRVGEPPR